MSRIRVVVNSPPESVPQGPSQRPLSHHEILRLMAPFTRRGRHLDMGATRRADRCLVFEPVEHPATDDCPKLREALELHASERGGFRIVRTLTPLVDDYRPLPATVSAYGRDLDTLVEQILGFPRGRHFPRCADVALQRSYQLESEDDDGEGPRWQPRLVEASAEVAGVTLTFDASVRKSPVKVRLTAPAGQKLQVPKDLLAVLGRQWRSMRDYASYWRAGIVVPKREPRRTHDIEQKFERTVAHLDETLARPPAQFHPRHRMQRWRAAVQRSLPLLMGVGLIGMTLWLAQADLEEGNVFRMLVFHLPPLMLLLFFLVFDELPDFELPRVPRQLRQDGWLTVG
jgi:hypothetical protein